MLLRVQYSCGVVLVFWFLREIVFDITYVLIVQYICAVVSFYWLWREIVLKMRTRFNKIILLGYFIKIQNQCEYIRSNTLSHCTFLFCIFLLYRTDLQVEVQIRILLKDKYEIMSKMRTPRITLWFPGKCLSRLLIIEKQQINLYVKRFQHSICIRSIWTKTNTEISFSFWSTLFYSISLS